MKFRYIGKKEEMKVFGYDFSNGATPDVTEETFIAKLSGNSHFEAVKKSKEKAVVEPPVNIDPPVDLDDKTEWPV
jgi:hypothetical protein